MVYRVVKCCQIEGMSIEDTLQTYLDENSKDGFFLDKMCSTGYYEAPFLLVFAKGVANDDGIY